MVETLEFDEATHTYRVAGQVLPGVTRIIASLYEGSLDMVNPDVLERKRLLGRAAHLACEYDDAGTLDEASLSPVILPYVDGWRKFKHDKRVEIISTELMLHHPVYRFAGMIDNILRMDFLPWVIDRKTTYEIHPAVGVQLAGYDLLTDNQYGPLNRAALRLLDDGTYRLVPFIESRRDDDACFRGLLAEFNWKRKYLK